MTPDHKLAAIRERHRLTVGQYQLSPAELDRGELLDEVDRLTAMVTELERHVGNLDVIHAKMDTTHKRIEANLEKHLSILEAEVRKSHRVTSDKASGS